MSFEHKNNTPPVAPKVESTKETWESFENETAKFERQSEKIADHMTLVENARRSSDHLSQLSATKYLEEVIPQTQKELHDYLAQLHEELGGLPESISMEGPALTV